jgi:hypothetical protein
MQFFKKNEKDTIQKLNDLKKIMQSFTKKIVLVFMSPKGKIVS